MKKNNIYEAKDFETLIMQHNPFAVKATDGSIQFFANYCEVYKYVLGVLYSQYSRGFVDLVLLVSDLTRLKVGDCEQVFRDMRSIWGETPERMIAYNWDSTDRADHKGLEDVMKCLHIISGTHFDEEAFTRAMDHFRLALCKEGKMN